MSGFKTDFHDGSAKFGLIHQEFAQLPSETKRKLVRLMARIMERAYRRGVQQALHLSERNAIDDWILECPHNFRYEKSLDVSIGLDGFTTSSIERLFIEERLESIGFEEEQ